jgi:hypothetical protein
MLVLAVIAIAIELVLAFGAWDAFALVLERPCAVVIGTRGVFALLSQHIVDVLGHAQSLCISTSMPRAVSARASVIALSRPALSSCA